VRAFELSVEFPTGTILVGGHSASPVGASMAHARDHERRPVIPATALRGALRENLEALLRGAGLAACDGGTGIDPEQSDLEESRPCTLLDGGRCVACRLFGSRAEGLEKGARVFSSLILGDATLVGEDVRWSDRQHVSVSRSRRSAEANRLFMRQTPQLHGRRMVTRGYTVEPEFDRYLEAAVRATTHLGSGRSIGLARVDIKLEWLKEITTDSQRQPQLWEDMEVGIRVTLESPTMLGGPLLGSNYRATRNEIPGSVLRGALGFAVARILPKADSDEAFQALFDERAGAHFGFLYPVGEEQDPGPWPLTARACKSHPHTHGVLDTLFDRIAAASIADVSQVEAAHATSLRACAPKASDNDGIRCGAPLRGVPGTRGSTSAPKKRTITRVSIDRKSSSARQGALFSYELLEPGAVFEGTIRNVPTQARALIESALQLPVHVGRGASSGWGRVKIEIIERRDRSTLEQRGTEFDQMLRAHFEDCDLTTEDLGHLVPITFLAPLLPDEGDEDGRATLARALGDVSDWLVTARRFDRDGGWDQQRGRSVSELAVSGGAVYVARLGRDWNDPRTLATLRQLERDGFGRRRHQGFGQAIFFDPFILQRKQVLMNRSEIPQRLRPLRRALVLAAERVITAAFAGGERTQPPAKSQFSRLVNICGEASCAEEIVNYLRYQAGREIKAGGGEPRGESWRVEFVNAVVSGIEGILDGVVDPNMSDAEKDASRVEAWRLYATYLTRAFTYQHAIAKRTGDNHRQGRRS
jgi:CRISPR-associated Csx10 family RAMP protein